MTQRVPHWVAMFVRSVIAEKGLNTAQIEREANVSLGTAKRWIYERRKPDIEAADRLLRALGYRLAIVELRENDIE